MSSREHLERSGSTRTSRSRPADPELPHDTTSLLHTLARKLPAGTLLTEPATMAPYLADEAHLVLPGAALAVVMPASTDEVSEVLRWASTYRVPVVPRGAGTGLSGGATAVDGCVLLSTAKLDRILRIDQEELIAIVQPGVINADLGRAASAVGLNYAPDPSSFESCTIGGNVATNAGGLCCVKYGRTRDVVLSLEAVLADGRIIRTGSSARKDVAGYDLSSLFVGSEGTLGVITEVTLKLIPARRATRSTVVGFFSTLAGAGQAAADIMRSDIIPSLLELIDQEVLRCIERWQPLGIDPDAAAMLIVQSDSGHAEHETEILTAILTEAGATDVVPAASHSESEMLVAARRLAFPALSRLGVCLVEDVSVPRSRLPDMLAHIPLIAAEHNIRIGTVAHAGDGNLHPTIVFDASDSSAHDRAYAAAEDICRVALQLGGTITGEHGIGVLKRDLLAHQFDPATMSVQRAIKNAIDPMNILNPGKVLSP